MAFSKDGLKVLESIADTVFGELSASDTAELVNLYARSSRGTPKASVRSLEDMVAFSKLKASDFDVVQDLVKKLQMFLPKTTLMGMSFILSMLSTSAGNYMLTGYAQPFQTMSLEDRTGALRYLGKIGRKGTFIPVIDSTLAALFMGFTAGISLSVYSVLNEKRENPVWKAIGFPGADPVIFERLAGRSAYPTQYPFKFLDVQGHNNSTVVLHYDAVVIGSGAGGGIVAAELSTQGLKVLVLEKGILFKPEDITTMEADALPNLYENGGVVSTEDGNVGILAGSSFGGGTTINWSGSLKLPQWARQEWADEHGLPFFASAEYEKNSVLVLERAGVSTKHIKHNGSNQILIDGCNKLGLPVHDIPQNTGGHTHSCGFCHYGCPAQEKQGAVATWLKDAANAGCHFLLRANVRHVIHQNGKAVGVDALVTTKTGTARVVIKALTVVVSAGSLNTPAILKRSGLKNKHIGKHLRLHPAIGVAAVFPDREVRGFDGSIMTACCDAEENQDGKGYGVRIEVPVHFPSILSTLSVWRSPLDHKSFMMFMDKISMIVLHCRERYSEGEVNIDSEGNPLFKYTLDPHDAKHLTAGLVASVKILAAAGGQQITTSQLRVDQYKKDFDDSRDTLETPEFQRYVNGVATEGINMGWTRISSAHQMGSCRLSSSPERGPLDPEGQTWEVKGLWVADASTLPTASGVNPMATVWSIAYSIAQNIKQGLKVTDSPSASASASARL
ncbi:hypothetical protein SmJEL517_g06010 [Synchytrium microbalum]|uniref:Long-chain-alcohol oxidase n=1 Tax=Synchytrium microbalum TaxID=1806994 RepID=A0A507BRT3_9FUNG|nr:uncharacterized protein SmJEL517_g06010 [Synchytrium microbalum]TPX30422.1 hypothetical protein SmJEL517_g06010 [Synchytrium microbalum]